MEMCSSSTDRPRRSEHGDGPLVLGWDTCTQRGTLVLGRAGVTRAEVYFWTEKGHLGWLMPLVNSTLKGLNIASRDIDALAVGIGPGNFTGVKVGVSTMKSIALALRVPLIGVPTLDILSFSAPSDVDLILSVIDARRGMLYSAAYRPGESTPRRVSDYLCRKPEELADLADCSGYRSLWLAGQGTPELVGLLEEGGRKVVCGEDGFPRGRDLLSLANRELSFGSTGDALSVLPIYLKKPT